MIFLVIILELFITSFAISKEGETESCITCHEKETPGIVSQWRDSKHSNVNVSCISCHKTEKSETDSSQHYGETIVTIVSPKDCGQCHQKEEKEFSESHHAKAAQFIGSLDNFLGVAVEGLPATISGCQQCHGSTIKLMENGKLDPATWPNTGIGRINPDGSKGSCSACHTRHNFSRAQARQPENCGKCHMGPDHPQIEIYKESKHGIIFEANRNNMNLESDTWIVGKDYTRAPTCATCHMGATPTQGETHDVGTRISWTLRPIVSTKLPEWEKRRESMKNVCSQCHSKNYIESFYNQFDDAVNLYNDKFANPAKTIIDQLHSENLLTKTPFDEKIEWTFYELWHHEGRRARHGVSMMGPDYTQWHGFYEVAKNFYTEFLPQAEELKKGITKNILSDNYHKWKKGLNKEEMEKIINFYKERYGQ